MKRKPRTKATRKLALGKDTLRQLTDPELERAQGASPITFQKYCVATHTC